MRWILIGASVLVAIACGSDDEEGSGAGGKGGSGGKAGSASGGTSTGGTGTGGTSTGGTNTGGTNTGGTSTGGTSTGGSNTGGSVGEGASGGSAGAPGGSGGSGGGSGGSGGSMGGSGGSTGGSGGPTGGSAGSTGGSGGSTGGSGGSGGSGGTGGSGGGTSTCAPLAPATGAIVNVASSDAGTLHSIVQGAAAGTTFVLADGTYDIASTLQLSKAGFALRSASNDATKVIIDGRYQINEPIAISASNVTVAHVTIRRAIDHPIHAYTPASGATITGTRIYGVHLIDGGEQFLKVNPSTSGGFVDEGTVECSVFRMTAQGRPNVEPCCGGCYTGGIDVHAGWNWVVRNNHFEGIYCASGLAEHAVHFWQGARGTLVENNVIVDCARGIGFGLGGGVGTRTYPDNPNGGVKLAHYDGVIRNNVIWSNIAQYDTGIELHIAKRPIVLHNTVVHSSAATGFFSSIDYRFPETDVFILNNLTQRITARDGAAGTVQNNLEQTPLGYFVNAAGGDFHLQSSATNAIDKGQVHAQSGVDIDGEPHDTGAPDLGADERP
jgi:hypothetical protein